MRAMMVQSGVHENPNAFQWPELSANVNKLESITVNPHKETCAYEKLNGQMPDYLRTFGEMGIV